MLLSALIVSGFIYLIGLVVGANWFYWILLSPILYIAWLTFSLLFSAGSSRKMGSRFPKPRKAVISLGRTGQDVAQMEPGGATVILCMFRASILTALPFVAALEKVRWFRKLIFCSYSPSVHIGKDALVWGRMMDPDLTEIGDRVVVGWGAELIAHSLTRRPDGTFVYLSAPIKVGAGATLGGSCYVALGAVIGEGAVVEPMAFVEPFTAIPAGETWGGVPARCVRKRGEDQPGEIRQHAAQEPPSPRTRIAPSAGDLEQARRLVAFALGLNLSELPQELSAQNCAVWDSLGQIAIATALHDSYGITVGSDRLYRLRTLDDIGSVIAERTAAANAPASGPAVSEQKPAPPPAANKLPDDLEMLPLWDQAEATRALTVRFSDQPGAAALRVVVASSSTAQPIATTMKVWGRAFGLELDCEFAGFNQITQTLLSETGPFASNAHGVNVVLIDPTDRIFDSAEQAASGVEELLGAIEAFRARRSQGVSTLVGTLPPQVSAFSALDRNQYEELRHQWQARLENIPGVQVFDFAAVVEQVGVTAARNSESEVLSRMPYSSALYQALGIALVRQILATRRSPAKVIAVDCDNTLWGGVLGEVGPDGIQIGSDGAGRGFQLFQRFLKQLKERGLLLAVVSKNEEADVLRVFENHPEMVLRPNDIAAWRVNWNHKSQNLQELAEELNLGSDSFVFLDDDAAIRMEVSMRMPGIHVVPLPEDHVRYCETLGRLWLFDGAQSTEADRKRTRMMQEESQRRRERGTAASLEEYLASLDIEVDIREPDETEWPRVAQLTQRTNQFNLSLKRRTTEEVKAVAGEDSVLIIKARDRFGDYGLVGVCIIRKPESAACEIDTLLMSCRVLGRGAEDAFLHAIARAAATMGAATLAAPYVVGPRNRLVKDFLARSRFRETQPNTWVLPVTEIPALPKHIRWVGGKEQLAAQSAD
jgi:FkbH-like protein